MSSGASTSDPAARALAWLKGALQRGQARFMAMSRPARVMLVSTVVAAVLITGYVGYRSSETTWTTLFHDLDRDDAAAVVAKLKEMKVPYRVEGNGTTIEVPQQGARELRLELAGAGLPRGGGVGFESFDKLRLGATEFEQRVLYRRSLEGELSRSIDTIGAVQSSRVHLVLPERSVFVGRAEPASASVVLKLRPGRTLGASEVASVVHLVSSSVAALTPDRVAVVTTDGTVLHKPRRTAEGEVGGGGLGSAEDEASSSARSLEATLEERARTMLEKVVGAGHVDVRVSAELDRARIERIEDRYDPKQSSLRSEQSSIERTSVDNSATGVPGAESNPPNAGGRGDGGLPEGTTRESHTRNFELDHITEKRLLVGGSLRRLTVAVVVDGGRGREVRSKEEVERLAALVRSAVGADERRGDVVTVEAVPFMEPEPAPVPAARPVIPERFRKYTPHAAAAGAALTLVTFLALVMRRRKKAKAKAKARAAEEAAKATAIVPVVEEPAEVMEALEPEELRARAHERAAQDPATAALVLRFWLGDGVVRRESDAHDEGTRLAS